MHASLDDKDDQDGTPIISLRFELKPARGEEVVPIARIGYAVFAPASCAEPDGLPWVTFRRVGAPAMAGRPRPLRPPTRLFQSMTLPLSELLCSRCIGRGLMPECLGDSTTRPAAAERHDTEFVRTQRAVGQTSHLFNDPAASDLVGLRNGSKRLAAVMTGEPSRADDARDPGQGLEAGNGGEAFSSCSRLLIWLHEKGVPGRPDLNLAKYPPAIFVHGCFWHYHEGCRYSTMHSTCPDTGAEKFAVSVRRDRAASHALAELGWRVAKVWEYALCKLNKVTATCAVLSHV